MATNFWREESTGVVCGYFPLVTFRLLACAEYNETNERTVVWFVQYREKTDEEPWYTELADTKFTDVEEKYDLTDTTEEEETAGLDDFASDDD